LSRRVAIITDTKMHVGPDLARELVQKEHDLVIGEPADGLADELREMGGTIEVVTGVADLTNPLSVRRLVDTALTRFGRLDAACIRTGIHPILTGNFLDSTVEELRLVTQANLESTFYALHALLPPMLKAGQGQIVIVTSATGAKPAPKLPLYSATRAAANMLVKNVALEVADRGVTVNAIGTNFLDYPWFREAQGADDPKVRKAIEERVPLKRLGRPEEVAHFCATLLDGRSAFQTGQFFSVSGGWSD
jgi:NAD(P)-dependent dehydrogenase (short-subunit alcohol dehydrogenase family)